MDLNCICVFGEAVVREVSRFARTSRNWRLGGEKIEGENFATLDSEDFALIRSAVSNEGAFPVTITFVSCHASPVLHGDLTAIVEGKLADGMTVYEEGVDGFDPIAKHCPVQRWEDTPARPRSLSAKSRRATPMQAEDSADRPRGSIGEKLCSPHIPGQMLRVVSDLSAPAQLRFLETVEQLAAELRRVLVETGSIVRIDKNHGRLWASVSGKPIGFVDSGLANLPMQGSVPVAARVGSYTVIPGERGPDRERFTVLTQLIDDLYAHD